MMPKHNPLDRIKRLPLPFLLVSLGLIGLILGMGTWFLLSGGSGGTATPNATTPGIPSHLHPTPTPAGPVSPLLFGTNLGLFNTNDQVLTSTTTRTLLQQIHARIIRMPVRTSLSEATEVQAAQIIKDLGAVPLLVLHGIKDANALADDTLIIKDMNRIFGNETVYYEYGNEDDLAGYPVERYLASWNSIVPQLKPLAPHAHFIGPVNFHYDQQYLISFLQGANPRPDEVSWHEYTCDDKWANDLCISHISHWTTHIQDARAAMTNVIGTTLPIMITEWNYAPNAVNHDGKNTDPTFMTTWTTTALQTLAANRVFASMQYSCTNTAIPMINYNGTLTTQGQVFQSVYQQIIVQGQQPTSVTPPVSVQDTPTPTPAAQTGPSIYSFEDGGIDGWTAGGQGISGLQNSTGTAQDGTHALQATLSNASSSAYPYASVKLSNQYPQGGQTVTAYVYVASNSISVNAKVFVVDSTHTWQSGNMITLTPGSWNRLTYTLPASFSGPARQLGIQFNTPSASGISTTVYIDAVGWS